MKFLTQITNKKLFTVFIYLLFIVFIHPFYEEGATPSRVFLFSAPFFSSITDWPLNQIFISNLFSTLYVKFPSISWYGLVEIFFILLILVSSYSVLSKLKNPLILIVFLVISIDDVVMMSFTRTATLLLLFGPSLLFIEINKARFKFNLKHLLYCLTLLFAAILGFLNKPYAASFTLALNGFFFFAYIYINPNKLLKTLKTSAFIILPLFIVFTTIFAIYINKSSPDHLRAISYSSDFYNLNSADSYKASLSTKDSVGVLMLENNFISDRSYYNDDFIERVTRNSNKKLIDFSKLFDKKNYKLLKTKYIPLILKNQSIELVVLFLVILSILFDRKLSINIKVVTSLFIVIGLCVIFFLSLFVKIELRVSSPLFLYFYFCVFVLLPPNKSLFLKNKLIQTLLFIFVLVVFFQNLRTLKFQSKDQERRTHVNQSILNSFARNFTESNTLILNMPAYSIIKGSPFKSLQNKGDYSVQTYDAEAMTYMDSFKKMLIDYCGSISMTDFYHKIYSNRENTFIISSDDWNMLIINYMKLVHDKELYFENIEINDVQKELKKQNLNIYKLSIYR